MEVLSKKEYCERFGLSLPTLHRLIINDDLPPNIIGIKHGHIVIEPSIEYKYKRVNALPEKQRRACVNCNWVDDTLYFTCNKLNDIDVDDNFYCKYFSNKHK